MITVLSRKRPDYSTINHVRQQFSFCEPGASHLNKMDLATPQNTDQASASKSDWRLLRLNSEFLHVRRQHWRFAKSRVSFLAE